MKNDIEMKNRNFPKEIITYLQELSKNHSHHPLGAHISMATDGSNLEFLTDRQLADALEVHLTQLNLDIESQIVNFNEDLMTELEDEEDLY